MENDQTEKAELLIITDQVFDGSGIDSYFLEYRVDAGRVVFANSCVLNDSGELKHIAHELIINYSDAIANLTAGNFTNKQNALLGRLFLFTDISTKRTEFLQSFDLLCNLLFLKKKFQSHQPQHIRIIGCNMMLKEIVQMTFPKSLVTVEHQSKYLSSRFRILLKNIVFFCRMLVVSLVLAVFRIKEQKFDERRLRVFLTRYPGRLSDAGQEQKYGHLVRPNDHYLASVLTDGLHQNLGFFNLFKRLNSAAATEKIILVDKYIRPLDAISGFWETLMDALKPINLQEPVLIEGIDLSPIINIEAQYSLLRLPRLVAIAKAYDRAFRHLGQQTTKLTAVYYLHEYAYGRMITTVLKKRHPNIRRIAMQHGPASPRKLVYAVSSRDWLDLLAPEVVLAEDQQSAALYRRFGYDRVSVMKQIPRLFVDRTASEIAEAGCPKNITSWLEGYTTQSH